VNYLPLGWQSWSPLNPKPLKLPLWDYSPTQSLATLNQKPKGFRLKSPISYWCSWYAHGDRINEQTIHHTIKSLPTHSQRFTHCLIDDGWCEWGDWQTPDPHQFATGIKPLSKLANGNNIKLGIWLSPFLASPKSKVFQKHSDWFLRNKNGHYINGFHSYPLLKNLNPKYILNFSLPSVQNYLYDSLHKIIVDWGVQLLKLDFLYAPYLESGLENDLLPHSHLKKLFSHLKKNYPDIFTIACGCPFTPATYLVDAIRISKDIAFPPPTPKLFRHLSYYSRTRLLQEKIKMFPQDPPFLADPDVQIPSLDTKKTRNIFQNLPPNFIYGFGDII
jgi:hypothetical protein